MHTLVGSSMMITCGEYHVAPEPLWSVNWLFFVIRDQIVSRVDGANESSLAHNSGTGDIISLSGAV